MTNRMKRPEMGTWHMITECLIKTHPDQTYSTVWKPKPIDLYMPERGSWVYHGEDESPPPISWQNGWKWEREPTLECKAMYCGYRYKKNGETHYENDGYEEGGYLWGFTQRETFEVWMFVTHENRNPIPVFPFEFEK